MRSIILVMIFPPWFGFCQGRTTHASPPGEGRSCSCRPLAGLMKSVHPTERWNGRFAIQLHSSKLHLPSWSSRAEWPTYFLPNSPTNFHLIYNRKSFPNFQVRFFFVPAPCPCRTGRRGMPARRAGIHLVLIHQPPHCFSSQRDSEPLHCLARQQG